MAVQVTELHNIMPIANIPSVLSNGILCHERAAKLSHTDVSMESIQERRNKVQVPGGLKLHRYANLYFHARNPMLYKRKELAGALCVLRVSTEVFKISGTIITDQNASSAYVRFLPPTDLHKLQLAQIFADDWRHPNDRIAFFRHKSQKCAEILVPYKIPADYISGAYVVSQMAKNDLQNAGFLQNIQINTHMFFR